jgi:hypothetical protein
MYNSIIVNMYNGMKIFLKENSYFYTLAFSRDITSIFELALYECFIDVSFMKMQCIEIRMRLHKGSLLQMTLSKLKKQQELKVSKFQNELMKS